MFIFSASPPFSRFFPPPLVLVLSRFLSIWSRDARVDGRAAVTGYAVVPPSSFPCPPPFFCSSRGPPILSFIFDHRDRHSADQSTAGRGKIRYAAQQQDSNCAAAPAFSFSFFFFFFLFFCSSPPPPLPPSFLS